jgi:integrase/recombinase XerD
MARKLIPEREEHREITRFVRWYSRHPDKSESTATRYHSSLRKWAVFCRLTEVDVTDPDPRDVEDFLLHQQEHFSEKTATSARAALSAFLQREGDFEGDTPVDRAQVGSWGAESVKESQDRNDAVHWLKPDQARKLTDPDNVPSPTLRNRLLIKLLLQTGIRASEVESIKIGTDPDWGANQLGDIDREKRRILVIDHKNDDTRPVFYQPGLDQLLRLWIEVERNGVFRATESEHLFPTRNSESIDPQRVNEIVKQTAENAGIQTVYATTARGRERASVTCHTLRHTWAMNAIRSDEDSDGMDVRHVQQALGHNDISTTVDRYLHDDEETLRREWGAHGPTF